MYFSSRVLRKLLQIKDRFLTSGTSPLSKIVIKNGWLRHTDGHFLYQSPIEIEDLDDRELDSELLGIAVKGTKYGINLEFLQNAPLDPIYPKVDKVVPINQIKPGGKDGREIEPPPGYANQLVRINPHYLKAIAELAIAARSNVVQIMHPDKTVPSKKPKERKVALFLFSEPSRIDHIVVVAESDTPR